VIVDKNTTQWWRRDEGVVEEYFPIFTPDNPSVRQFLDHFGWSKTLPEQEGNNLKSLPPPPSIRQDDVGSSSSTTTTCPLPRENGIKAFLSSRALHLVVQMREWERSVDVVENQYRLLGTIVWMVMLEFILSRMYIVRRRARSRSTIPQGKART